MWVCYFACPLYVYCLLWEEYALQPWRGPGPQKRTQVERPHSGRQAQPRWDKISQTPTTHSPVSEKKNVCWYKPQRFWGCYTARNDQSMYSWHVFDYLFTCLARCVPLWIHKLKHIQIYNVQSHCGHFSHSSHV